MAAIAGVALSVLAQPAGAASAAFKLYPLPRGQSFVCRNDDCFEVPLLSYGGLLWFGEPSGLLGNVTVAGHFSSYSLGTGADIDGLAAGPGGALWFSTGVNTGCSAEDDVTCDRPGQDHQDEVAELGSDGSVTWHELQPPNGGAADSPVRGTTLGPGAQLYVPGVSVYSTGSCPPYDSAFYVYRFDVAGQAGADPVCGQNLGVIATDASDTVWVQGGDDATASSALDRLGPNGSATAFSLGSGVDPESLVVGPDKRLWSMAQYTPRDGPCCAEEMIRLSPGGTSTIYRLDGQGPSGVAVTDGALWMLLTSSTSAAALERLDPGGGVVSYKLPLANPAQGVGITIGPDGAIWVALESDDGSSQYLARFLSSSAPSSCSRAPMQDVTTSGRTLPVPYIPPAPPPLSELKYYAHATSTAMGKADVIEWAVRLGLLVLPPGEAIEALVDASDVLGFIEEKMLDRIAEDPPDARFRAIARPSPPSFHGVRPGGGITSGVASAFNALARAQAEASGYGFAFLHAIERGQGAARARSAAWVRRQDRAAAVCASALAHALHAVARDRSRLARTLRRTKLGRLRMSSAVARRTRRVLERRGLPRPVARALRRDGFSRRDIARAVAPLLDQSAATPSTLAGSYAAPAVVEALTSTSSALAGDAALDRCVAGS